MEPRHDRVEKYCMFRNNLRAFLKKKRHKLVIGRALDYFRTGQISHVLTACWLFWRERFFVMPAAVLDSRRRPVVSRARFDSTLAKAGQEPTTAFSAICCFSFTDEMLSVSNKKRGWIIENKDATMRRQLSVSWKWLPFVVLSKASEVLMPQDGAN